MINIIKNILKEFTIKTEIQEKTLKYSNKNLIILSPCGSGKTESAYEQIYKWNSKSLFVVPMKVLCEDLYNRFQRYDKDKWTIQYSSNKGDEFLSNKYSVTTIDQVLNGYLGLGKQSFIKGKNVLQSNLVLDELQLYTEDILLATIKMLDELHKKNRKFVIMSATMPRKLIDFLSNRYDAETIICEKESVKDRKVYINYCKKINFKRINNETNKQIIICNTQSEQKYILENIEDKDRVIILNNKLLKTDREKVIEEMNKYFSKGSEENNKILIATQVIEAGVDISANILYSFNCPIDSLIQRVGRCCRYGGTGQIYLIEYENMVYDNEIVTNTNKEILKIDGSLFDWTKQKELVDIILNDKYDDIINKLKSFKLSKMHKIRDIENVSIIVSNTYNIEDFNKESVSISKTLLKKLSKSNKLYIKNKGDVENVQVKDVDIGDTILIEGNDCFYDKLGFRYEEDSKCDHFKYIIENNTYKKFDDYIEESWINHAISTKMIVKQKLINNTYSEYIKNNIDYIANICGLHDLGKLDEVWQGKQWANSSVIPLAHFPFRKNSSPMLFHHRNHATISAIVLKDSVDKIMFNVLLQHHKRILDVNNDKRLRLMKYNIDKKGIEALKQYGFNKEINIYKEMIPIMPNEIITPDNKEWGDFLYIVGVLMESDIEAIKMYNNTYKVA